MEGLKNEFGKTLLSTVVSAVVVSAIPAIPLAVPVVPNFTQVIQ